MTNPLFSVVVVAGDVAVGLRLAMALQPIPGVHVVSVDDPALVLAAVRDHDALVVVGDAAVVADGARPLADLRSDGREVGVIVTAERPSLADAVQALRARVDEFFPGELDDEQLRVAVVDVVASVRRRRGDGGVRSVLAVASTLDDVLLGAGGTLRMHADGGDRVVVVTTETFADDRRRAAEALAARLGVVVRPLSLAIDAQQEEIVEALAPIVVEHAPSIVYTHGAGEGSATARRVHRATVEVTPDASRVSCFQASSASLDFAPTLFVDIDTVLEQKVAAIVAWSRDARDASAASELARATATYWSRFGSGRESEPFQLLRDAVEISAGETARPLPSASPDRVHPRT